jgi:LysR family transcriptional regulator, regulator of gene expression of beta-lactamase
MGADAATAFRGPCALSGEGIFRRKLERGDLVQPFAIEADLGGYRLSRLMSRAESAGMAVFRDWLTEQA